MREKISNIATINDVLAKEMCAYGANDKTIRNALLAVEELLLLYKDKLQNYNTDVKVEVSRGTKIFSIQIAVLASEFSLATLQNESGYYVFDSIIKNSGFSVNYSYVENINQIEIVVEKYFGVINNFLFSFKFIEKKTTIFIAFFFHIVSIVASLFIPALTGELIALYTDNVLTQVIVTALSLLFVKLVYNITFHVAGILYSKVSYYSENVLRKELVSKMFLIRNNNFEKNGTGTFTQRLTSDLQIISIGITNALDIFSESVYYIGVLIATATLSFQVFLVEVFMFAILFIIEKHRAFRMEIDIRKMNITKDYLSSSVIDYVNGISEVKLLNARKTFTDKIASASSKYADYNCEYTKHSRTWVAIGSCAMAIISCLIMLFLGYNIEKEVLTIPVALILFNYFTIIDRSSVALIQRAINFFKEFNLATERVRNLYEGNEFTREVYGNLHVDELYGDVVFDDVTFAYNHDDISVPDLDIIKNVSFTIKRGETVAFVGKSGTGKSTILRMLLRQIYCYSGNITIDGYNLFELDLDSLHNNISVISQPSYIFNCSIKENLLIAKPDATMEELKEACTKACILEDIERTENGFDSELGEKGVRFSGGQQQRLAIARALLRNTNILLLDEATSAVDNITQDKIMNAIEEIGKDHTVIIIAHRLSTIKKADRIMLVDNGKIVASGTHEQLMETSKEYRNLYGFENK